MEYTNKDNSVKTLFFLKDIESLITSHVQRFDLVPNQQLWKSKLPFIRAVPFPVFVSLAKDFTCWLGTKSLETKVQMQ